jgi:phosphoglycerate dehydrogenase-like enzyme
MTEYTKSDKKYEVCSDFSDSLNFYNLPKNFLDQISSHPKVQSLKVFSNIDVLAESNCDIFFGHRITSLHLDRMPNLKWIHLGTSGYDKIDLELCKQLNITVTNSNTLLAESLASHALSFIFALMRYPHFNLLQTHSSGFSRKNFDNFYEKIKTPSTCSILIFGSGLASVKLASWLVNMKFKVGLVSVSNRPVDNLPEGVKLIDSKIADDILGVQDFIVNLLPGRPDTYHYFCEERLARFSNNTCYINVGRGSTTDEKALIDAINRGLIGGVALDVFEKEPLNHDSLLFKADLVLMTPHVAAISTTYWHDQVKLFLENLNRFSVRGDMQNEVKRLNR